VEWKLSEEEIILSIGDDKYRLVKEDWKIQNKIMFSMVKKQNKKKHQYNIDRSERQQYLKENKLNPNMDSDAFSAYMNAQESSEIEETEALWVNIGKQNVLHTEDHPIWQ
jgi:hypothetical protein